MYHVAAGKHPWSGGLHKLIDHWAVGDRMDLNARLSGQLIFRHQSHREQNRVTGNKLFLLQNGTLLLIHWGYPHAGNPLVALDAGNGVG